MSDPTSTYLLWAVALGGLSALSLPLGSAVGLATSPRPRITSFLAAFGAGALIAALAVELVAPIVEHSAHGDIPRSESIGIMLSLVGGCLAGGILFVVLDQLVNAHGGFLRKSATTLAWFSTRQKKLTQELLRDLCRVSLLRHLPPEQIELAIRDVRPMTFTDGDVLFGEGTQGDRLYFIRRGQIELLRDGRQFKNLGEGEVLGEIALLTGAPRTATAEARGTVETLALDKEAFDRWRRLCPELDEAARNLATERIDEIRARSDAEHHQAEHWASRALSALRHGVEIPSRAEVRQAHQEHSGAPLAIWLGILLDGIPESFVIGSGFLTILTTHLAIQGQVAFTDVVPYTLIAGLFLSNFPEALSSSVEMRSQGWGSGRILFLWTVLLFVTAFGAGVGFALGEALPELAQIAVQGTAAGAMLTMIASTMIPEAVHSGGRILVGLSTLGGFLSAVMFKIFE